MITTLRRQVVKQCPYRPETDFGELVITLDGPVPDPAAFRVALASAIAALTAGPVSHEDYTAAVAGLLPPGARAASTWRTGGWTVEVSVAAGQMTTTLRRPVTRRCPPRPEAEIGELTVIVNGPAPELHALGAAVDAATAGLAAREDHAAAIAGLLPPGTWASTTWQAGWAVEVSDAAVSR